MISERYRKNIAFVMMFVLLYFLGGGIAVLADTIAGNTRNAGAESWGLGYGVPGQQPTANATKDELKKYDAYYVGASDKKVIYLTFDAGYENGYTAAILDVLKRHQVPAAFFLVGHYLESSPDMVKRMVEEGHIVANHTYSHPDMSGISSADSFCRELSDLEELFKEITGRDMIKFYRPPQGKYNTDNLKMAKEMGYKTFFWSLAYVDWYNDRQPTREHAFEKLLGRIHPGAIVLLHSTSRTNSEILDELIIKWKDMGYTFGSLTDFSG